MARPNVCGREASVAHTPRSPGGRAGHQASVIRGTPDFTDGRGLRNKPPARKSEARAVSRLRGVDLFGPRCRQG